MNVQELIDEIYDASNPEKQRRAARDMRHARDPRVVPILFGACYEAKDARLQQEAVRSLAVLAPERAFQAFMKSTHHPDPERRRRGFYHLGTLGDPGGIPIALKGLRDQDEPESVTSMVGASIEAVEKRMSERRDFNGPARTFNEPAYPGKNRADNSGRSFNSVNRKEGFERSKQPKSYTPRAF